MNLARLIDSGPGYTPLPGYGKLLPSPPAHVASDFSAWFFLFWAGLLVVCLALPWAIKKAVRQRDYLPLLALGSGLFTSLGEPMLDLVGHLRWSQNLLGPAFSNFGIAIPVLIPPCYALFMGLEAYWIRLVIARGVTTKGMFSMFAAVGVSDAIMEHPGVLMGVYEYYGRQPLEFYKFPFYWSFTNGVAITTIGVMLFYVWPLVKDNPLHRLAILPLGVMGTMIGEFGSGFPVFLGINANIPTWLQWAIGCLTIPISIAWIKVLSLMVAKEDGLDWSFWGLFRSRFMTPAARDRFLNALPTAPEQTPAPV